MYKKDNTGYTYFDNILWRKFLSKILEEIDPSLQIISPFGFEVLKNRKFLYKNIRKFYCYIGIPTQSKINKDFVAIEFESRLFKQLDQYKPQFYNDIVLKVIQDKFILLKEMNYKCKHSDKLIDIQCRYINDDILNDYTEYLICSINGLLHKRDEPKGFEINKRFRVRTYQLYLIIENIFAIFLPAMNELEANLYFSIFSRIDNTLDMYFNSKELHIVADEKDKEILNKLIVPRVKLIHEIISQGEDIIELTIESYHVEDKLNQSISKKYYEKAKEIVKYTYLSFY